MTTTMSCIQNLVCSRRVQMDSVFICSVIIAFRRVAN
jgi:hypothetical protein